MGKTRPVRVPDISLKEVDAEHEGFTDVRKTFGCRHA
jgi:hypothetical protein